MVVPAAIVNIYNLHYTMTSTGTKLHTRYTVTHALHGPPDEKGGTSWRAEAAVKGWYILTSTRI